MGGGQGREVVRVWGSLTLLGFQCFNNWCDCLGAPQWALALLSCPSVLHPQHPSQTWVPIVPLLHMAPSSWHLLSHAGLP